MLYQHSFWYRASQKDFEDALKADPECGIAYWGIALSLLWNPHVPTPAKNLAEGAAAIAKAKASAPKRSASATTSTRCAAMYADYDKVDHRRRIRPMPRRWSSWRSAIRTTTRRRSTTRSRSTLRRRRPTRPTPTSSRARPSWSRSSKRQPQHPGVAHYLIHLYDYPPIAEKGLEAARRYAKIAPGAAHAQHMPSHIFTRVGYWKESIASNIVAARVAKEANDFHDQLHAMDYLVYAYLQLGQDAKAKAVIDEMTTVTGFTETFLVGPYALAVSPARYAIERGDWKAAAALAVRPSPLPQVQAMTYFARALGAARSGQSRSRQGRNRQARRTARQIAARTPIGPSRSISSGKLRPLGALCRGQARRRRSRR